MVAAPGEHDTRLWWWDPKRIGSWESEDTNSAIQPGQDGRSVVATTRAAPYPQQVGNLVQEPRSVAQPRQGWAGCQGSGIPAHQLSALLSPNAYPARKISILGVHSWFALRNALPKRVENRSRRSPRDSPPLPPDKQFSRIRRSQALPLTGSLRKARVDLTRQ